MNHRSHRASVTVMRRSWSEGLNLSVLMNEQNGWWMSLFGYTTATSYENGQYFNTFVNLIRRTRLVFRIEIRKRQTVLQPLTKPSTSVPHSNCSWRTREKKWWLVVVGGDDGCVLLDQLRLGRLGTTAMWLGMGGWEEGCKTMNERPRDTYNRDKEEPVSQMRPVSAFVTQVVGGDIKLTS